MITNNRLEGKFLGEGNRYSFGGTSSACPPRGHALLFYYFAITIENSSFSQRKLTATEIDLTDVRDELRDPVSGLLMRTDEEEYDKKGGQCSIVEGRV
jgi:hypothetical protein